MNDCFLCTKIISDDRNKDQISEFCGRLAHKPCIKIAQPRVAKNLCALCGKNRIFFSYNYKDCSDSPNRIGF